MRDERRIAAASAARRAGVRVLTPAGSLALALRVARAPNPTASRPVFCDQNSTAAGVATQRMSWEPTSRDMTNLRGRRMAAGAGGSPEPRPTPHSTAGAANRVAGATSAPCFRWRNPTRLGRSLITYAGAFGDDRTRCLVLPADQAKSSSGKRWTACAARRSGARPDHRSRSRSHWATPSFLGWHSSVTRTQRALRSPRWAAAGRPPPTRPTLSDDTHRLNAADTPLHQASGAFGISVELLDWARHERI